MCIYFCMYVSMHVFSLGVFFFFPCGGGGVHQSAMVSILNVSPKAYVLKLVPCSRPYWEVEPLRGETDREILSLWGHAFRRGFGTLDSSSLRLSVK